MAIDQLSEPAIPAQELPGCPARSVWATRRLRQDPVGFLQALSAEGDIVPFSLGRRRALLLCHPTDIERVLVSHHDKFAKGPIYERARQLLGNGLFTAEGTSHRRRKSLIQPAFHRASFDRYGEVMVRHAAALCDQWTDGDVIDLPVQMQTLTMAIVGETLFGADLDAAMAAEFREAVTAAIDSGDSLLSLLAPIRKMRPARERLSAVVHQLIERRLQSDEDGDDLLAMLLQGHAGSAPDQAQLHDDVLTLLFAGNDTIANTLTWTWVLSSLHTDAREKLYAELDAELGSRRPSPADLPRLVYTRAVLAESLRLQPPAWALARVALTNVTLDTAEIPEGTLVVMSQFLVHRDPRFHDRPLTFDPDRWLQGPAVPRSKCSYFPFGAGPRSCIGEGFAWMEGILLLATLAQQWQLTSVPPNALDFRAQMTLRPVQPLLVHLHRRS